HRAREGAHLPAPDLVPGWAQRVRIPRRVPRAGRARDPVRVRGDLPRGVPASARRLGAGRAGRAARRVGLTHTAASPSSWLLPVRREHAAAEHHLRLRDDLAQDLAGRLDLAERSHPLPRREAGPLRIGLRVPDGTLVALRGDHTLLWGGPHLGRIALELGDVGVLEGAQRLSRVGAGADGLVLLGADERLAVLARRRRLRRGD